MRRVLFLSVAGFFFAISAHAQDSPSLGDVARQARAKKQPSSSSRTSTSTPDKPSPKTPRVYTNEDLPSGSAPAATAAHGSDAPAPPEPSAIGSNHEALGERLKAKIQSQKEGIAALESQISEVGNSIHYAGANCVSNCEKWNERQQQKQQEVDGMKAQLAGQQKQLEDMQESARQQGFGSSIYDP